MIYLQEDEVLDLLQNVIEAPVLFLLLSWSVPPRSLRGGQMFHVP